MSRMPSLPVPLLCKREKGDQKIAMGCPDATKYGVDPHILFVPEPDGGSVPI